MKRWNIYLHVPFLESRQLIHKVKLWSKWNLSLIFVSQLGKPLSFYHLYTQNHLPRYFLQTPALQRIPIFRDGQVLRPNQWECRIFNFWPIRGQEMVNSSIPTCLLLWPDRQQANILEQVDQHKARIVSG